MLPSSREGLAAFDRILFDSCALVRPPQNLDCAEWADKYGMLPPEGASMPGKFFISNAEYQREPLRMLSDVCFQTVVLMWSSQVGKTQIGLFGNGYYAEHDPCPQLIIQPSEDMAKVISNDRLKTMIRDTPVLRAIFPKNPDTFNLPYPGGQINFGWASSPAQLASRPIRYLHTDEEGRYGPNVEGDAVDQGRKRLATFRSNRKHLRTSSPALLRTCRITKAFGDSDQRHYYVPCPQCGHMQTLRWEQLKGTHTGAATTYYVCEANGCEITEADKFFMVRRGEWRAHNPGGGDGRTAGFHLNALYSTIGYEWAEIIAEYIKCNGIPDKLQVFTNTVLALPWDEQAEGADMSEVQKHAEDYEAQAPAWVLMVTCGTDVQKDRIESTKWGWGLNETSGVIEHRVFHGATDIAGKGAWSAFDAWRRQRVEHVTGVTIPVAVTFIDSGDGNRTQQVYEYCRPRESQGVRACKGSSQNGAVLVSEAKRVGRLKTLLVMIGTSTAKDTIYARLKIAEKAAPGYIHFPNHIEAGCGPEYFKHLTAEVLVTRSTRGGEVSKWENPNKRNEALDCAVYAFAAKVFSKANLKELARKLELAAARITPAQRLAAKLVKTLQPYVSSASSAPSPSPQVRKPAPRQLLKKRRKPVRVPGFSWIHGR